VPSLALLDLARPACSSFRDFNIEMSREEPKPSRKMHEHCLLRGAFGDRIHNIAVVTLEF